PGEQERGEVGCGADRVVGEGFAAGPPGGEEVTEDAQADGDAADGDDLHCGVLQRTRATPSAARVRMNAHVPDTGGTARGATEARRESPARLATWKKTARMAGTAGCRLRCGRVPPCAVGRRWPGSRRGGRPRWSW